MSHLRLLLALPLLLSATAHADDDVPSERTSPASIVVPSRPSVGGASDDRYFDPVSVQGQQARGLYVPAIFARNAGTRGIIEAVRRARLDAAVIDLKDSAGRVTYDTKIPILQGSKVLLLRDAKKMIRDLKAAGIYTIARIVCFADPKLPARHPDRAIQHNRRRKLWVSWGTGGTWLDPYSTANHDMIVELTREAEALGFDEIQLDYIRFPVDDGVQYASYPTLNGGPHPDRPAILLNLLRRIDEAVKIPLGVDVFGLTAFRPGDNDGLGQDLERWAEHVEVFTPMLYLNSMPGWEAKSPDRAYRLVAIGVRRLRNRVGDRPVIRPFLQAFEVGADEFTPKFIADQVRGARHGSADGFLFWHPGARYTMLNRGMNGAARGLYPFEVHRRAPYRLRPPSAFGDGAREAQLRSRRTPASREMAPLRRRSTARGKGAPSRTRRARAASSPAGG